MICFIASRVLDALGDRRQAEALRQIDDRVHDLGAFDVGLHRQHERPVDLDLVEAKLAQMVQAGVARAEIVERNLDADVLERDEDGPRRGEIADQRGLGDFDLKPRRRETRSPTGSRGASPAAADRRSASARR